MFRFRSVNNIVIAPAKTGNESNNRIAVIKTDHTNNGTWSIDIPALRILKTVEIKLIAPRIDDAPARWREKIAKSTALPLWAIDPANGGYKVQPVPTPLSTKLDMSKNESDGGKSQNLMLFIRGNAISGLPSIKGTSQLPKPPIMIGITIKKIIIKACAVTMELYIWSFSIRVLGDINSVRMMTLNDVPINLAQAPKIK